MTNKKKSNYDYTVQEKERSFDANNKNVPEYGFTKNQSMTDYRTAFIGNLIEDYVIVSSDDKNQIKMLTYDKDTGESYVDLQPSVTWELYNINDYEGVIENLELFTLCAKGKCVSPGGGGGNDPLTVLTADFEKSTKKLSITAGNSSTKSTEVVIDIDGGGSGGGNDLTDLRLEYSSSKLEAEGVLADSTVIKATPIPLTGNELLLRGTGSVTIADKIENMELQQGVTDVVGTQGSFVDASTSTAIIPNFSTTTTTVENPQYLGSFVNLAAFIDQYNDEQMTQASFRNSFAALNAGNSPTFKLDQDYAERSYSIISTAGTTNKIRTFDFEIDTRARDTTVSDVLRFNILRIKDSDGTLESTGNVLEMTLKQDAASGSSVSIAVGSESINLITNGNITSTGPITVGTFNAMWEKETETNAELIAKQGVLLSPTQGVSTFNTVIMRWVGGILGSHIVEYDGGQLDDANHKQTLEIPADTDGLMTKATYDELKKKTKFIVSASTQDTTYNSVIFEITTAGTKTATDMSTLFAAVNASDHVSGSAILNDGKIREIVHFSRISSGGYFVYQAHSIKEDGAIEIIPLNAGATITVYN